MAILAQKNVFQLISAGNITIRSFILLTLSSTLTGDQVVLEKNEKDIRITDTQGHYRTAENTETLLKEIVVSLFRFLN